MNFSLLLLNYKSQRYSKNKWQNQQGFTLIELLIVVIITGILSAVALPSMLNQARRAREASARNNLGAVNRSQQVYRLENSSFSNNMANLTIDIPSATNGYNYSFGATNSNLAEFSANPSNNELQAFTGCVTAVSNGTSLVTSTRVEAATPGSVAPSC